MKKYLLKIALFFVFMAVIDMACGWAFGLLRSKAQGGQTHKNEYISHQCEDDILILGSSKADHHYVPNVFEDSLGLSCYNAGEMGCGIIPAYIRYMLVSERYKPKLVIYEVTPSYDYLIDDNGYSSYLGVMRQYCDNNKVRNVYVDFSNRLEAFKLLSYMYRNNSKLVTNVKDILSSPDAWNGYEPLYGKVNPNDIFEKERINVLIDSLKLSYMEQLVKKTIADSAILVFIISPVYLGVWDDWSAEYAPIFNLCKRYNLQIINNLSCESFKNNSAFFQDGVHLNHKGAVLYTQYVLKQVKEYIQK